MEKPILPSVWQLYPLFQKYLTYQHRDNEESVRQAEYYIINQPSNYEKDAKFKLEEYQKNMRMQLI